MAAGRIGKREHMFNMVVSMWSYLAPRRGGQIQLNDEYLVKYFSVIKETTVSKYNSALLAAVVSEIFEIKIQKQAVTQALNDIDLCKQMVDRAQVSTRDPLVKLLALQNQFTLVAYPVSYHYDIFGNGRHSLENKLCFNYTNDDT